MLSSLYAFPKILRCDSRYFFGFLRIFGSLWRSAERNRSSAALAIRVEPARAVAPDLVYSCGWEHRHHALAARATHHEEHTLRPFPETDQIIGAHEDAARLGQRGGD